ncbi:FH1/FH2 domain-containing protein 3 [Orchesella cincta]|uniref:FH1/FH2 domain-containing protein 3 n=1 Tax=Orchesella cincta TaxID=48709 RepID=A0A1D2MG80_ORCCI|nr:FH1/FH2 domain-containing protein 3 [Orchesella cincta]
MFGNDFEMIQEALQSVSILVRFVATSSKSTREALKQSDANKTKEITVLDPKRSNAINIGMTKLPPPRTIKAAIMKMDSTIINREGIEKLLSMLPTEEERAKITKHNLPTRKLHWEVLSNFFLPWLPSQSSLLVSSCGHSNWIMKIWKRKLQSRSWI